MGRTHFAVISDIQGGHIRVQLRDWIPQNLDEYPNLNPD